MYDVDCSYLYSVLINACKLFFFPSQGHHLLPCKVVCLWWCLCRPTKNQHASFKSILYKIYHTETTSTFLKCLIKALGSFDLAVLLSVKQIGQAGNLSLRELWQTWAFSEKPPDPDLWHPFHPETGVLAGLCLQARNWQQVMIRWVE